MPVYFYTPAVPLANQQKNQSQPIMQANFQAINELITQDHVGFNQINFGEHNKVTFNVQGSAPAFGGQEGLFSMIAGGITDVPEIFVNTSNFGGTTTYPMTASVLSILNPGPNSAGFTYLPSGLQLKWNGITLPGGSQSVTFPTAYPHQCVAVFLTTTFNSVLDVDQSVRLSAMAPNNFTVYCSFRTMTGPSPCSFNWLAIGY